MTSSLIVSSLLFGAVMPGYFVGWGTLSLINAGLAQSKNHSGFLWWFLSLFLGPVATLIIVLFLQPEPVYRTKPYDEFG